MSDSLIFGDDGSASADVAWLWINSHAWPGWSITVVNAGVQPPPREALRQDLAHSLTTARTDSDPRLELHTRGATSGLVVVGARGQGFFKRMGLGSTAEWLMHGPSAPLVIARTGRRTRRILLADDGSTDAKAVQEALCAMPWIKDVTVRVLTVAESLDSDDIAEQAAQRLTERVGAVETRVVPLTDLPVFTRPREVILDEAEAWGADLIALGSRGRTLWATVSEAGLQRAGSTATGVTRQARVNVMLAQAR